MPSTAALKAIVETEDAARFAECISSNTSKRCTEVSRGATMPRRTPSPLTDRTSTTTSLPITSFSPTRRVRTSIFQPRLSSYCLLWKLLIRAVRAIAQDELNTAHRGRRNEERRTQVDLRLFPFGRDHGDCQDEQLFICRRRPMDVSRIQKLHLVMWKEGARVNDQKDYVRVINRGEPEKRLYARLANEHQAFQFREADQAFIESNDVGRFVREVFTLYVNGWHSCLHFESKREHHK